MPIFVDPRTVLKRHGLRPKRSWGQNFLISSRAVEKIARLCVDEPGRKVVEIGPGPGTLTQAMLSVGGQVIAVERERDMCRILEAELGDEPGLTVIEADAATFDYGARLGGEPVVIAGNLPYQITGRILRQVLDLEATPLRAVFTVQAEVANRLVARPGDRARGALSVMVDARYEVKIALRLRASAFYPKPKVRSAVVELTPRSPARFGDLDGTEFNTAVKAAFTVRRKTLRNALLTALWIDASSIDDVLHEAGVDPRARAQHLETEAFANLARARLNKAARSNIKQLRRR
jgi:16S rRNA (adenine1518-N6/adenine1519-N6)-dimethyltransferase